MRTFLVWMLLTSPCWAAASRSFDNANDNISMGNVLDVTTGSVSVACWIRPNDDAEADAIMGKKLNNGTGAGYALRQNTNDQVGSSQADGTTQAVDSHGPGSPVLDVWAFAASTWNGSTDTAEAFANGASDGGTATTIGSITSTNSLIAGEYAGGATDYNGEIAYCAVFVDDVLTTQQIAELQFSPLLSGAIPDGLWPLWGDTTEVDLSGNGYTGTVTGATTSADGPPVMIGIMIL